MFKAYIVKPVNEFATNMALIGILIGMSAVPYFYLMPGRSRDSAVLPGLIITGFVCVILSLFIGGGKLMSEVSKDVFSLDTDAIQIGLMVYPFAEIANLELYFSSFQGQSSNSYLTDSFSEGLRGTGNYCKFIYKGIHVEVDFYLAHEEHMSIFLGAVMYLKQNQVSLYCHDRFGKVYAP
jgi:hypothetical protein